ncbi:MAG: hypothetical protein HOP08_10795 [Cyclobacteriaceae bacterium]|nr:hypothetical protein [Cyclobacteriaceae bacterium]
MKTFLTLSLFFVAIVTMAQTKSEVPAKEFAINLSESTVYLKPGESKQVTVSILRSKYYAKESALLGFSSALPKGITAQYEPAEGKFETSVVTITANSTMTSGIYQIILNGTLAHKTKGSILKISVGDDSVAVK